MIGFTILFFWIFWPVRTHGQELVYHEQPRRVWSKTFNAIGEGNGVYLTPAQDKLIAVSRSGILRAYDPTNGDVLWTFSPPLMDGGSTSCQSGITFVEGSESTYLAYMVIDAVASQITTRVLTVSLEGTMLWESASVPGQGAGTPQGSKDGRHFAITHNLDQQGHFSLFDTSSTETEPIYQYQSDLVVFDRTTPFSAVGVYHTPTEGFYDSDTDHGRSNINDLFLFMTDTNTDVLNARGDPRAGNGQMYVFQFPVDYFVNPDATVLEVIPIGNTRGYQAKTAPVLASDGQAVYWNMVRGEVRAWFGQRFSRGHSGMINLERGDPQYISGRASPTLSHDPVEYFVCGPGASNEIWKADPGLENVFIVATDAVVSGRLSVTLDDAYVVYGTQSGALHLAMATDLSTQWAVDEMNPIKGDLAVDETHIFVGDDQGNGVGQVVAWEMAYVVQDPTPSPTSVPTLTPSLIPTTPQTQVPTRPPITLAPTRVDSLGGGTTVTPTGVSVADSTASPNLVETSGAEARVGYSIVRKLLACWGILAMHIIW